MRTRAAVLRGIRKDWEITELDLDPPKAGEVLVRFTAAGLCHSDDHLRTGDVPVRFPIVGGHEGAGVVEETGAGVSRLKPGDHIVCSFLPVCGHCRFCARGMSNLCDLGALLHDNCLPDRTFRSTATATTSARCACSARSLSGLCCPNTRASRSMTTSRSRPSRWSAAASRPGGARR